MTERVRSISFSHFRGLPNNEFDLKNRNLVLLGSNGKGKSAVVDGIEFLFAGQVGRFVGDGTGGINHNEAVQHINKLGDPCVSATLSPSNQELIRTLGDAGVRYSESAAVAKYLASHGHVDTFILRRARILDFIFDQEANRYQKFVRLLGITKLDDLQKVFVGSDMTANERVNAARASLQLKLAPFNDQESGFEPSCLAEIYERVVAVVKEFRLEEPESWEDVAERLVKLKEKRPGSNSEKIDALTKAILNLQNPLPADVDSDMAVANSEAERLKELRASSEDAPRSAIITAGQDYLEANLDETDCPLCERQFDVSLDEVLTRLYERATALSGLRQAEENRRQALIHIGQFAKDCASKLKNDLNAADLIDAADRQKLRDARASALRLSRLVANTLSVGLVDNVVTISGRLTEISVIRAAIATRLETKKAKLLPPDTPKLEKAIALLERAIAAHEDIASAERTVGAARELQRRSKLVNTAFTKARETAIQDIFKKIAGMVLKFYRKLHDFDNDGELSECTDLELVPTSRARAGGLKLAIQFLGLEDSKDPRAFLSEAHLDSLGLCLFLATVRIFNPPGTLLVLDDVLTSIDKEHRKRVGDLLFTEFVDYQVVITTHDEYWASQLESNAVARGVQKSWKFMRLESWNLDAGPSTSEVEQTYDFISANLIEANYRNLGGPFRVLLEDFLKRVAVKIQLKVEFRIDGAYTVGDFVVGGITGKLREELINKCDPSEEADIKGNIANVLGQDDLINALSHDKDSKLEITLTQAKDFVSGLQSLAAHCKKHGLIKGK